MIHPSHIHSIAADILALKHVRIFVAGDIILDTYIEGRVNRISPEAPVPVVLETARRAVPGGAGNVAANIAAMGATAFLCGRVGSDIEAVTLRNVLEDYNIKIENLIVSKKYPTTTKMRVMSGNAMTSGGQQIVRIDKETTASITEEEELIAVELFKDFLKIGGHRCLILSDYGKGFLTKSLIRKLIDLSKINKIPIVTDPKSEDVFRYSNSTVIKPNLSEGRSVFKVLKPGQAHFSSFEEEIKQIADCYLSASASENLVMSLSEHGVMARGQAIKGSFHLETRALQVADVSGAGDTLVSFIAMCLAAGFPLDRSTELGNIAAGIVCGKLGTATVSPAEFLEAFKAQTEETHPEKILDRDTMVLIANDLRAQKRSVIFTNGCFDILHAGHVDYLQKAKSLGNVLIVALNADASVTRLKGHTRPIQSWSDRAAVLAALACTDYIIEFTEDTPLESILKIKPDILVKGADYTIETTVGAKEVLSWGGKVEHIDLLPGRSTTSILKKALTLNQD